MDKPTREEISTRFRHHPPKGNQIERYERIREQARVMALDLVDDCPASRELSLALTKLEECVMWANASIARRE